MCPSSWKLYVDDFPILSSSLACLEPELELFEVWEINVRQIIIIANGINSQTSNSFSSGKTGNFTALLHIPLPGNILPLILENMSCYCTKYSSVFQNVQKINFLLIFFFVKNMVYDINTK